MTAVATSEHPADDAGAGRWWLAPLVGLVAGAAVVGPGLGSGPLLNLDLAATPELRVPPGIWGLGPALTQRVPLGVLEAWVAVLLGGPATVKLFLVLAIAAAYAGMERLARPASTLARHGAALIYAIGPFAVTRAAVGHLNVLWVIAALPWILPTLLRPSRRPARTFLALSLLAVGGTASAMLGLAIVAVALVVEAERRPIRVAGAAALAALPWLVPSLVVLFHGASVGGGGTFRTAVDGPAGPGRLLAGSGFWVLGVQVGGTGLAAAAAGLAVGALALVGLRSLPASWRRAAGLVAAAGLVLAAASAVPGVRAVWDVVAGSSAGAPIREGQRFLLLWLVVALPAAAHGADRLADRASPALVPVAGAVPLVLALVLAAPGIGGAQGALEPRHLPAGWAGAARQVADAPGTTLVLPWHLYYTASFADGRTILNPGPDVLGGDTISSFDPEVGGGQEQIDPRYLEAARILEGYRNDRPGADRLAALGVRWVFVPQEFDWAVAGAALADDPGLRPVSVGDGVLLYEVRRWRGPLRTPDGGSARVGGSIAPLRSAPASGGTWSFPGTGGWLRGTDAVPVTDLGLLAVPAGDGPLWFWPSTLILAGNAATLAGVVVAVRRLRADPADRRQPEPTS